MARTYIVWTKNKEYIKNLKLQNFEDIGINNIIVDSKDFPRGYRFNKCYIDIEMIKSRKFEDIDRLINTIFILAIESNLDSIYIVKITENNEMKILYERIVEL